MGSSRSWVVVPIAIILALFSSRLRGVEQVAVHVAGSERPAVLDLLDPSADLLAVAISSDGNRAAVAVELSAKPQRSELRLYELGREAPRAVKVTGRIRDLLFSRNGAVIYALQHLSAKKREGDTFLLTVDWATVKARRGMRVPASAKALDHWIARDALLIAGRNEIRTVLLPELHSGPLFRVPGENASVASLGGDVILVGQSEGLVLIDLGVPSGREAMPIADRTDSPDAVVSLAAKPDGRGALARLADGRLFSVELEPLALGEQHGSARDVTAPVRRGPEEDLQPPVHMPQLAEPEPPPTVASEEPTSVAPETLPVEVPATPVPESPPPPVEIETPEPEPAEAVPSEPPAAETTPEAVPPEPVERPEPAGPAPQIQGRIEGPDAGRVESVVLFGPDNILREAARVQPSSAGRWEVDGLAPGRYRVELSGGGGSVLVTEPRFLLLTVTPGEPVQAPVFKVVRAL